MAGQDSGNGSIIENSLRSISSYDTLFCGVKKRQKVGWWHKSEFFQRNGFKLSITDCFVIILSHEEMKVPSSESSSIGPFLRPTPQWRFLN